MADYLYEVKIPKLRVAVLIGKHGKAKKELEKATKTTIKIDSKEGDVSITGSEPLGLYNAREIVKAVGRGFNPEKAVLLLKYEYCFEEINLAGYYKSKTHFLRLKGRVIGTEGRSRKNIEDLTETTISVYGKTICIIGEVEKAQTARRAIEMLLAGKPHSVVYKWLETVRKEQKRKELFGSKVKFNV